MDFGDKKNLWSALTSNILNKFAPKHSAILDLLKKSGKKVSNSYDDEA